VTPACCSIAVGEEVMALDNDGGVLVDLERILDHERAHRRRSTKESLAGIPVVSAPAAGVVPESGGCRGA